MVHTGIKQRKRQGILGDALKWYPSVGEGEEGRELDEETRKKIDDIMRDLNIKEEK